jgi:hypothetical protein
MTCEVRKLDGLRRKPDELSWVLVEQKGESYFLSGCANGIAVDPHISPLGFDNALDAIRMALIWAEYLEATVLFVRDEEPTVIIPRPVY